MEKATLDPRLVATIAVFQRNEITERHIYGHLAKVIRGRHNAEPLARVFGLTFGITLMERGEGGTQLTYGSWRKACPGHTTSPRTSSGTSGSRSSSPARLLG